MSTKIYNAYEWKGSIHALLNFLNGRREDYIQRIRVKVSTEYRVCKLREETQNPWDFNKDVEKLILSVIDSGGWDKLHVLADAVIYFYKGRIFLTFHGFDDPTFEKTLKHRNLKNFEYTNQTDCPQNIDEKDWNERGKIWDKIFKNHSQFKKAGLVFPFLDRSDVWADVAYWIVRPEK
jgi:hypothetical protein